MQREKIVFFFMFAIILGVELGYTTDIFTLGKITFTPSLSGNSVDGKLFGYKCLDSSCSNMDQTKVVFYKGDAWNCFNTASSESEFENCISPYKLNQNTVTSLHENELIMVRYEDVSVSDKYATYYFARGYVGYVDGYTIKNVCPYNICKDPSTFSITISKMDEAEFQLENVQLENLHNRNEPLTLHIPVKISTQACNTLRFNGIVSFYPPADNDIVDYNLDGYVKLKIMDESNSLLFEDTQALHIPPQTCSSEITFTWTPTKTRRITANWDAVVQDSQILNGKTSSASAQTVVYDPNEITCQSILTSVSITNENGDPRIDKGEKAVLHFEYTSRAHIAQGVDHPINSTLNVEIKEKNTNKLVYQNTYSLSSSNTLNLKHKNIILGSFNTNDYTAYLGLKGDDNQCASYNIQKNDPVTYSLDFKVYSNTYKITFHVYDSSTLKPINNAQIKIVEKQNPSNSHSLSTNANGIAEIYLEGDKGYTYLVSKQGYESANGDIQLLTANLSISVPLNLLPTPPSNHNPVINNFKATPPNGSAPLHVVFSYDVSDVDGDSLTCYFDADSDGRDDRVITNCNQGTFSFDYNQPNNYYANLKVTDEKGGESSKTILMVVDQQPSQNHAPVINTFNANPTSGYAPLAVTYNYDVNDVDDDSLTCRFDFNGDGVMDKIINNCKQGSVSFTFTNPGSYISKLNVSDGKNYTTAKINIEVKAKTITSSNVSIDYIYATPSSGYIPLKTTLSFKVHTVGNSILCNVSVEWGDGTSNKLDLCSSKYKVYEGKFTKTYYNKGTYTIVFSARDNESHIATQNIQIIANKRSSGGGGGGGHHVHHHGGSGGGRGEKVEKGDVSITNIYAPYKMEIGKSYLINVEVKNHKASSISSLYLTLNLDKTKINKKFNMKANEKKNITILLPINKQAEGKKELIAKITWDSKEIDSKTKEVLIYSKHESEILLTSLKLKNTYKGDEPISFKYCVKYTDQEFKTKVYAYVDHKKMKEFTVKKNGCYSAQIGNVFRWGEHILELKTKNSSIKKKFIVERSIYLAGFDVPYKIVKNKKYTITAKIESSTPADVSISLLEGNKIVQTIQAYIIDNDIIKFEYVPRQAGNITLSLIAESNGEEDRRAVNIEVVESITTGFLISTYSLIAAGIVVLAGGIGLVIYYGRM